jgi:hypothetical protein
LAPGSSATGWRSICSAPTSPPSSATKSRTAAVWPRWPRSNARSRRLRPVPRSRPSPGVDRPSARVVRYAPCG